MTGPSLRELNARVRGEAAFIKPVLESIGSIVIGQQQLINRMLIGLLSRGHILIEGMPGLAKTLAVRTLAATISADFQRIQFTPDLLPSDLIGTQIYNPSSGSFYPQLGPIFSNIVLADEINRAPAKVQSALLEAMEERQATIGNITHPMQEPFMVLATQNPIEHEGTYPLPEAQLDRFGLKVVIDYPKRTEERAILQRMTGSPPELPKPIIEAETLLNARKTVDQIYVDERIQEYVLGLVFASRDPQAHGLTDLNQMIEFGVSPRATIALIRSAKAAAFIDGRSYVTPDDIKSLLIDVFQHRIILTFEAEAEGLDARNIITRIAEQIPVP